MQTKNEGGFTLVELLLVIVILGILAAIVVAAVGNTSTQAKQNSCAAEVKTIRSAIERYIADNPTATRTSIDGTAWTNGTTATLRTQNLLADDPGACSTLAISDGVVTGS